MKVFILATCRKENLAPYTLLVFKTLRVGFPTAEIHVHINGDEFPTVENEILDEAARVSAKTLFKKTIHHEWIDELVKSETEPFYIVDTDMIFYRSFEGEKFDTALAGYRVPEWMDARNDLVGGAISRPRLHPSLLYIDPVKMRAAIAAYESQIGKTQFTPKVNLFYPLVIPLRSLAYFYDTCSLLYNAIGGTSFSDRQKDAYFHFNFGTISDLILAKLPEAERAAIIKTREEILANPQLGQGQWRLHDQYYENHQFNYAHDRR